MASSIPSMRRLTPAFSLQNEDAAASSASREPESYMSEPESCGSDSESYASELESGASKCDKKSIIKSACLALLYLNGGEERLPEQRRSIRAKSLFSYAPIQYLLSKKEPYASMPFSKSSLRNQMKRLRLAEVKREYEDLTTRTITTKEGKKIPAIYRELSKFGVELSEHNAWIPEFANAKSLIWDKDRSRIVKSACMAIIHVNGGRVELPETRRTSTAKSILTARTIYNMLKRGDFPTLHALPEQTIEYHLEYKRKVCRRRKLVWENKMQARYDRLKTTMVTDSQGKKISKLDQELSQFGIQPEEFGTLVAPSSGGPRKSCVAVPKAARQPKKSALVRKRLAEEPLKDAGEPPQKMLTTFKHWKKDILAKWDYGREATNPPRPGV